MEPSSTPWLPPHMRQRKAKVEPQHPLHLQVQAKSSQKPEQTVSPSAKVDKSFSSMVDSGISGCETSPPSARWTMESRSQVSKDNSKGKQNSAVVDDSSDNFASTSKPTDKRKSWDWGAARDSTRSRLITTESQVQKNTYAGVVKGFDAQYQKLSANRSKKSATTSSSGFFTAPLKTAEPQAHRQKLSNPRIPPIKDTAPKSSSSSDVVYQPQTAFAPQPVKAHPWDITDEEWAAIPVQTGPRMSFREVQKRFGKPERAPIIKEVSESEASGSIEDQGHPCEDAEAVVHNMIDWEGKLLPPPVDGIRHSFRDPKFHERIEAWLAQSCKKRSTPTLYPQNQESAPEERRWEGPSGELAPRFWVPQHIEPDQSAQQFLDSIKLEALQPYVPLSSSHLDGSDMPKIDQDSVPFWSRYDNTKMPALRCLDVPEAKIDYLQHDDILIKHYKADQGSQHWIAKKLAKLARHRQGLEIARARERENKRRREIEDRMVEPPPNRYRPKINMYIRPAQESDMKQITDIYNHYVTYSCTVFERDQFHVSRMQTRFHNLTRSPASLPFLVAVSKNESKGTNRPHHFATVPEEAIIGFTYLDEECQQFEMWEYTMNIEIFVHPEHLTKGIGKNLLDRMLWLCDADYDFKNGCDFNAGPEGIYIGPGSCQRLIHNIICYMPLAANDRITRIWKAKFLEDFGFRKVGVLDRVGIKNGIWYGLIAYLHFSFEADEIFRINRAIFQHATSLRHRMKPSKPPELY